MTFDRLFSLLAIACLAPAASAQFLLVVDSTNDRVIQVSAFDGSVVDASFIDLSPAIGAGSTATEALVVDDEIWVSDAAGNRLMRFSLDGTTWLGNVTGGIDQIRGIEFVNGEVLVTNSGTSGGAPGAAIVRFSPAGANLGSFPVGNPFDVLDFQGGLLIPDITGDDLVTTDYAGVPGPVFHASDGVTGINFPQQVSQRANGNVLAGGFSAPAGIYEYDSTGMQINYWAVSPLTRGVHELGNGKLLFTASIAGVSVYDPVNDITTSILGGFIGHFITEYAGAVPPMSVSCPGDGSGTACPCGNDSAVGAGEGCLSSLGVGGKLAGSGTASIAADTVVLNGTQMPSSSALYFQGTMQAAGGAGAVFGDGLRCAAGTITRLKTVTSVGGASQYPQGGDPSLSVKGGVVAPGTRTYQVWYRNAAAFCTASTFNLTSGLEITWAP